MTETEKKTGVYDPYSGNVEPEETRSEKIKKEAREKFQEIKESASEKKEKFSKKLSETTAETQRAAREAGDKARDAGAAVYDAISENLFPTILTVIGAAWLTASILRSRSESDFRAESSMEVHEAKSRLGERAKEMGDKAKQISARAREKTLKTKEKSREIMTKNTFYVAGALAAMGLLVGLAFPETRGEQRLFNELRDEFQEGAETQETGGAKALGEPETF